ncbi:MAG: M16 family metallopeptidase, partial [Phycisphaerae bacterium]
MKRITHLLAIIPVALLCAASGAQPAGFPETPPVAPPLEPTSLPPAFSQKLGNGMEVVCVTSDEIPWVSVSWYLLAGAKFDPPGKAGLASATADLLRQGTTEHDTDALAELLDFHAIDLGGSAGHETTAVYCGSLDRHVDLAVKTLAEVVRTPTFPKREFHRHMAQQMDGLRVAEADGSYWAGREIDRRVYGRHYLSQPAGGTSQSLPTITRDDVIAFHKTHYMPNNALLVFSGAIQSSQAMELANKHFGDWKA